MRGYILMLCAVVVMAGCGKDKENKPEPQITENEPKIVDTLPDSFTGEISMQAIHFYNRDSNGHVTGPWSHAVARAILLWHIDLGAPKLNNTILSQYVSFDGDTMYLWTDITNEITLPTIWEIPANRYFDTATFIDPTPFPQIIYFPDTIKLSEDLVVQTEQAGSLIILMHQIPGFELNYAVAGEAYNATSVKLERQGNTLSPHPNFVNIDVYATNNTGFSNNKATSAHTTRMTKWVRVVE